MDGGLQAWKTVALRSGVPEAGIEQWPSALLLCSLLPISLIPELWFSRPDSSGNEVALSLLPILVLLAA